jgi:hypothetical protein
VDVCDVFVKSLHAVSTILADITVNKYIQPQLPDEYQELPA